MTATYDAVLFDLDGVLTSTASLHAACWEAVFDEVLDDWARRSGDAQEPFDVKRDYLAHVDFRLVEGTGLTIQHFGETVRPAQSEARSFSTRCSDASSAASSTLPCPIASASASAARSAAA
jgi:beta-phosphoglucomutase-like phosphatase (HAD superfamily)